MAASSSLLGSHYYRRQSAISCHFYIFSHIIQSSHTSSSLLIHHSVLVDYTSNNTGKNSSTREECLISERNEFLSVRLGLSLKHQSCPATHTRSNMVSTIHDKAFLVYTRVQKNCTRTNSLDVPNHNQ
ncbi:hypothetical protein BsWGS_00179 [Bradybaena similaris]